MEATRGRTVIDKLQPHGTALVSAVGISHSLSDICGKEVWLILALSDNDILPENYVPMQKVSCNFLQRTERAVYTDHLLRQYGPHVSYTLRL